MDLINLKDRFARRVRSIPLNLRMAWVKPVLRDHGMDTGLTVYDASGCIDGYYVGIPDLADHDIAHMVAGVFQINPVVAARRGERYARNLVEGQAVEVENVLFNKQYDFRGGDLESIRTTARRGLYKRIAARIAAPGTDQAAQPHLTGLSSDRLHSLIDRGIVAGAFAAAVLNRNPAAVRGDQLLYLPLSVFGVEMIENDHGQAESFKFYPREIRESVIAAL